MSGDYRKEWINDCKIGPLPSRKTPRISQLTPQTLSGVAAPIGHIASANSRPPGDLEVDRFNKLKSLLNRRAHLAYFSTETHLWNTRARRNIAIFPRRENIHMYLTNPYWARGDEAAGESTPERSDSAPSTHVVRERDRVDRADTIRFPVANFLSFYARRP